MHVCPELENAPHSAPPTAREMSASSHTIMGSLPPSSRTTGVSVSAAAAITRLPGATGAGEADLLHAGAHQRLTRATTAGDDLHDLGVRADVGEQLAHLDAHERGDLGGLEDDRVAGEQRRQDRGHGEREGVVPRADDPDHAERFEGAVGPLVQHRARLDLLAAQHLLAVLGVVVDELDGGHQLGEHGLVAELAGLAHDDVEQLLRTVEEQVAHGEQVLGALGERHAAPGLLRGAGPLDRRGHLGRAAVGDRADDLTRAGVAGLDDGMRGGGHATRADEGPTGLAAGELLGVGHDDSSFTFDTSDVTVCSPVGTGVICRCVTPASP